MADSIDRYSQKIERDKRMIFEINNIISKDCNVAKMTRFTKYPLSLSYSKHILNKLMNCIIKTKHCGFLYDEPQQINRKKEQENVKQTKDEDEQKTLRMEIDEQEDEKKKESKKQRIDQEEEKEEEKEDGEIKIEYFCRKKLNKNGSCPVHKHWRNEKYQYLLNKLKKEIEEIFVYQCVLRHIKRVRDHQMNQVL